MQMDKKTKKKKVKVVYVDDGRTIYDMSGVTRPGQVIFPEKKEKEKDNKKNKKNERVGLTRAERWAVIKAAYAVYLPMLFGVVLCFFAAAVIMYLLFR